MRSEYFKVEKYFFKQYLIQKANTENVNAMDICGEGEEWAILYMLFRSLKLELSKTSLVLCEV